MGKWGRLIRRSDNLEKIEREEGVLATHMRPHGLPTSRPSGELVPAIAKDRPSPMLFEHTRVQRLHSFQRHYVPMRKDEGNN